MREIVLKMKGHGTQARPKVDKHDTRILLLPFPARTHTILIDNSNPLKEKVNEGLWKGPSFSGAAKTSAVGERLSEGNSNGWMWASGEEELLAQEWK